MPKKCTFLTSPSRKVASLVTPLRTLPAVLGSPKQMEAIKHILTQNDTTATRPLWAGPQSARCQGCPPVAFTPAPAWPVTSPWPPRQDPAGRRSSLSLRLPLSPPSVHLSGPDMGSPEMEGTALNQEVVIAPLTPLPRKNAGQRTFSLISKSLFLFHPPFQKKSSFLSLWAIEGMVWQ